MASRPANAIMDLNLALDHPSAALAEAEELFSAGRLTEAEARFRSPSTDGPDAAQARFRLGQISRRLGKSGEATEWLRRALELQPEWAEAHHEMGLAWLAGRQPDAAVASLLQALAQNPGHIRARESLADLLSALGNWKEACAHYGVLIEWQPQNVNWLRNYGLCCQELGEFRRADKAYTTCLELEADSPELRFNLGVVKMKQCRFLAALEQFQAALQQDPNLTLANLAQANIHRQLGDLDTAEACLRRELEINPNCADAAVNLGVVLQEKQRVNEAIACYRQAIELNPHHPVLHWNFAIASLMAGNFETGWNEYEWRWQVKHKPKPRFPQPEWNGHDLEGRRILLYAEQGFGDTLMFIRFAKLVAERHGRVIVQCQPPLKRLLSNIPELTLVKAEGEALPEFDVQAPLMSLPRIFGSTLDTAVPWEPYLQAPAGLDVPLPAHRANALKVGLVWASNPQHPVFAEKSLALSRCEPILKVRGCEFFSLQIDPDDDARACMGRFTHIHEFANRFPDFAETAAAIEQLDLVISVDTAVAHLAGALGRPVWVMLSFGADWRWLLKRKDSPWYPSMQLFRQPRRRDWESAVAEAAQQLTDLVTARGILPSADEPGMQLPDTDLRASFRLSPKSLSL